MEDLPQAPPQGQQTPDLNTIIALLKKQKEEQSVLRQLAQPQQKKQTLFDSGKNVGSKIGGWGASPEESRRMLQVLGTRPDKGETRMSAWGRGMNKAIDARNSVEEAAQNKRIEMQKLNMAGTAQEMQGEQALYNARVAQDSTNYTRNRNAVADAAAANKMGTISFGGNTYYQDASGRVGALIGPTDAPPVAEPFSLSPGEQRMNPDGTLLAQNTNPPASSYNKPHPRQAELDADAGMRQRNIERAVGFIDAFTSGAESGTSRAALDWMPGVWTDQGSFDEELDAFAEEAARAQLKANGEIRPTDTDVEGQKEALFGVPRDEATNINLLKGYLQVQIGLENEARAFRGLPPLAVPEGRDLGKDWYQKLYSNKSSGNKTNQAPSQSTIPPYQNVPTPQPQYYDPATPPRTINWRDLK